MRVVPRRSILPTFRYVHSEVVLGLNTGRRLGLVLGTSNCDQDERQEAHQKCNPSHGNYPQWLKIACQDGQSMGGHWPAHSIMGGLKP